MSQIVGIQEDFLYASLMLETVDGTFVSMVDVLPQSSALQDLKLSRDKKNSS